MNASKSSEAPKAEKKPKIKKRYRINIRVDRNQLEQLKRECKQAGRATMAGYIRERVGLERKSVMLNPVKLLQTVDKVGTELTRISDNMDRVGRYTDSLMQTGEIDNQPIQQFNLLMEKYIAKRRELVKAYRAVIKMV